MRQRDDETMRAEGLWVAGSRQGGEDTQQVGPVGAGCKRQRWGRGADGGRCREAAGAAPEP